MNIINELVILAFVGLAGFVAGMLLKNKIMAIFRDNKPS